MNLQGSQDDGEELVAKGAKALEAVKKIRGSRSAQSIEKSENGSEAKSPDLKRDPSLVSSSYMSQTSDIEKIKKVLTRNVWQDQRYQDRIADTTVDHPWLVEDLNIIQDIKDTKDSEEVKGFAEQDHQDIKTRRKAQSGQSTIAI